MLEDQCPCIYCGTPIDPRRGQGDHVIPAALGRFQGELVFRRICPDCNGRISLSEQQMLRCTPEAYMRRIVKPVVQRNRRGSGWTGANGIPPPRFHIDHGDHFELADPSPDDPRNVFPFDQLVLVGDANEVEYIRLHPQMTVQNLRARIEDLGDFSHKVSYVHASDAAWETYTTLLAGLWPNRRLERGSTTEVGVHRVRGRTLFKFHADYWRAIAKIALHYYLVNNQRHLVGSEPDFAKIRRFILEGGNKDPLFSNPASIIAVPFGQLPDGAAILPKQWCHCLAVDESGPTVVVMVCLFMGPEFLATVHHITVATLRSPIIVPGARFAHTYIYHDDQSQGAFAGLVQTADLKRLR